MGKDDLETGYRPSSTSTVFMHDLDDEGEPARIDETWFLSRHGFPRDTDGLEYTAWGSEYGEVDTGSIEEIEDFEDNLNVNWVTDEREVSYVKGKRRVLNPDDRSYW